MSLPQIEEWIKEVEQRPESAATILKLIAGRLQDLTERNEALLAENIALQDGNRVEEYRKRIAHLEYQLDLLKRRYGLDAEELAALPAEPAILVPVCLLVYNAHGRILRVEPDSGTAALGHLNGELSPGGEPPRLLALPANEELLLLFTSGRVSTCSVAEIPSQALGTALTWDQAALPDEPRAGERLACITPLSWLSLADAFLQTSRRGCLKKTMTSIAETVFDSHFIGKGVVQKMDQPFDLMLCRGKDRLVMVTCEGRLVGLNVEDLSYSVEERLKLSPTDHLVASFVICSEEVLICLTQNGKIVYRDTSAIEFVNSTSSRGQALIPPTRLDKGVRFIGAASAGKYNRVAILDTAGDLNLHTLEELTSAGSVRTVHPLLAFSIVPASAGPGFTS